MEANDLTMRLFKRINGWMLVRSARESSIFVAPKCFTVSDTIRVTKRFTFDMAHALYGYDGPCKNIHGHTYHLAVTVAGVINIQEGHPELGLVVDFSELKEITRQIILSEFDHALVLKNDAPYSRDGFLPEHFEKVLLVPFQPSCENLLMHFHRLLMEALPARVRLVALRLDETPTSYAEWRMEDQR
jgi:6-pyruvoyltetrahydropterin/6-carboxytetrahydropterin synthase